MSDSSFEESIQEAALNYFSNQDAASNLDDLSSSNIESDLLQDQLIRIHSQLVSYKNQEESFTNNIKKLQKELMQLNQQISNSIHERDEALKLKSDELSRIKESEQYQKLQDEKVGIENQIVRYKIGQANVKTEMEEVKDQILGMQNFIKLRDNEIKNLNREYEKISRERDALLQKFNGQASHEIRKAKTDVSRRSDSSRDGYSMKKDIKPFPNSSFSFNIGFNSSSRRGTASLNSSAINSDGTSRNSNRSLNSSALDSNVY
ncbi:unnamed protein product [Blepharisma stoltei]|uniref:Uncharacterized protein n=1 Tax=Blepharisma stoltei TaxID=1481888 RepID=A0AAU9K8J7_9CILI|nr:unnamed protein product [Blepharisma stoltei]